MRKKLFFTVFICFLPVLDEFNILELFLPLKNYLLFDVRCFITTILVLAALRIITIIYFFIAVFSWVYSGFNFKKIIPCIISLIAVFCIDYSIKAIINNLIKRIQNRFKKIPAIFIKRNIEIV